MVYGTAAGAAAHKVAAVGLQRLEVALAVGVLVLPDDHCTVVPPKVERDCAAVGLRHEVVLNRYIQIGVGLLGNDEL